MTIGIIGAMDEEVAILLDNMTEREEHTVANCLFVKGRIHGKKVVLLKSGIGKVNAAMATTIMHERFKPAQVINTGSAGGFHDDLEIGDIVISTDVVHHDVDATAFDYEYGQVPGMPLSYQADSKLVDKVMYALDKLELPYKKGLIATGDSFMDDEHRVRFVKEKFNGLIAAEMEASAIAQVCYQYGIPFVIIRALSDIAGKRSSVSFDAFLEKAAKNASDLILSMLKEI
ncbi:5'-methylthioadenosine/S-adenosylhomocysteine nucleosidase [Virgibacillus kimchii]